MPAVRKMLTAIEQMAANTLPYIKRIREGLAGAPEPDRKARRGAITANTRPDLTPAAVQARPAQPGWTYGTVDDPILRKLDQLIALIGQMLAIPENQDTVTRLSKLTKSAVDVAEELYGRHQLSAVRIGGEYSVQFGNQLQSLKEAANYYARLAFYRTPEGIAWLRDIMTPADSHKRADGKLHVHAHRVVENLSADGVETWSMRDWQDWYLKRVDGNQDPLEHFVDFLLSQGINLTGSTKARLALDDDYRGVALARVRNGLPGSKDFPPNSEPRIFTFQVRIAGFGAQWWTIPTRFVEGAVGLPILRPLHSDSTHHRGVSCDFTRGSIYAMDGPDKMFCLPAHKHHSALSGGDPVSAAGVVVADNGRVVAIDNRSGHYRPGYRQLLLAVRYLMERRLFEPDGFAALYISMENALYLGPTEFIWAAASGFDFALTTSLIASRAKQFRNALPVASRHAQLIPPALADFPVAKNGKNRWDWMVAELYSQAGADLQGLVNRLLPLLDQEAGARSPGGWVPGGLNRSGPDTLSTSPAAMAGSQRAGLESAYRQAAATAAQRLRAGGAYFDILPMLDRLVSAGSALSGPGQSPPANVNTLKTIRAQAAALSPAATSL